MRAECELGQALKQRMAPLFVHHYRQLFLSTPQFYLSLPHDSTGNVPQISPHYALWPCISCMGGNAIGFFAESAFP